VRWSEAQERLRRPVYAPLAPAIARLPATRWPDHADLDAAAAGIVTASGMRLRFVAPGGGDGAQPGYEMRIARRGEVETRLESWHDLFNALAWITYPRAKARLNAQHAAFLEAGGAAEAKRRGPARDALTLFDEGGVAVASSSPQVFRLIADFQWKGLFWSRRAELARTTLFAGFGHALFEQSLEPFIGMVAKTVFLAVDPHFFEQPFAARIARIDALLDEHFSDAARFRSPKMMAPMPVLGVPGWHPDTDRESFYDDPVHFRGPRPK
jgi:hypothetical protein